MPKGSKHVLLQATFHQCRLAMVHFDSARATEATRIVDIASEAVALRLILRKQRLVQVFLVLKRRLKLLDEN